MEKPSYLLGYFTLFFTALYAVFKFTLLPGANVIMIIAGVFIAIYFPLLFLYQLQIRSKKQNMLVHKFGALMLSLIILTVVFRFNDWSLMGFKDDQAIRIFTLPSWIYIIPYTGVLVFIPWLIYTNYIENKKNLAIDITGGLGLAIIIISLIALDYHWLYRKLLFQVSNGIFILIYIPLQIRKYRQLNKELSRTFQILIIAYILVIFVYLVYWRSAITYLDVIESMQ